MIIISTILILRMFEHSFCIDIFLHLSLTIYFVVYFLFLFWPLPLISVFSKQCPPLLCKLLVTCLTIYATKLDSGPIYLISLPSLFQKLKHKLCIQKILFSNFNISVFMLGITLHRIRSFQVTGVYAETGQKMTIRG